MRSPLGFLSSDWVCMFLVYLRRRAKGSLPHFKAHADDFDLGPVPAIRFRRVPEDEMAGSALGHER